MLRSVEEGGGRDQTAEGSLRRSCGLQAHSPRDRILSRLSSESVVQVHNLIVPSDMSTFNELYIVLKSAIPI